MLVTQDYQTLCSWKVQAHYGQMREGTQKDKEIANQGFLHQKELQVKPFTP